jgi:hypothetical protein
MLVTVTDPVIPTDEETETGVEAVPPGADIFKLATPGVNVRVCALAVSGLHMIARAAKATNPVKLLCLCKRFLQKKDIQQRGHPYCGSTKVREYDSN